MRVRVLVASSYQDELNRLLGLLTGHDDLESFGAIDLAQALSQIDQADILILSWELRPGSEPLSVAQRWANKRNGPLFITTGLAKTQDECHRILGDKYQYGMKMYLFDLSDAAFVAIIRSHAKDVWKAKRLEVAEKELVAVKAELAELKSKSQFPSPLPILPIIGEDKRTFAITSLLIGLFVYVVGGMTGEQLLIWLKTSLGH